MVEVSINRIDNDFIKQLKFKWVSGSSDQLWAISDSNELYRSSGDIKNWERVETRFKFKDVSIGQDGYMIALSDSGEPYEWIQNKFQKMNTPHKFIQITVGNQDNVWALERDNHIWRYTQGGWNTVTAQTLSSISCGYDGTVLGVDVKNGWIFRFDSRARVWNLEDSETRYKDISVNDAKTIEAVGENGRIYAWNPEVFKFEAQRGSNLKFISHFRSQWIGVNEQGEIIMQ
jgi:hypothetical protein